MRDVTAILVEAQVGYFHFDAYNSTQLPANSGPQRLGRSGHNVAASGFGFNSTARRRR